MKRYVRIFSSMLMATMCVVFAALLFEAHAVDKETFSEVNDPLYSKLKSYKEEVTTEAQFLSDGWNIRDAYFEKIGCSRSY